MGSRQPASRSWWESETEFIEREGAKPTPMGAFHSYCEMQANFATKDGFHDLSERILITIGKASGPN